jgi:superkiller protein 3
MLYRAKGEYDEASKCFDYVLAIDENDLNGWFHKATTFLFVKKYSDALTCYQRILDIVPNEVATLFNMAECYDRTQDHEKAQEYFRKVLKVEPDSPQAIICLAMSFFNQGNRNKAFSVLHDVLEKNPDAAEYHAALGELYCENKDFEKGLPHVFRAVEITKDQPEFIATVCYAMIDAGLHNEALNFIESKMVQSENYSRLVLIRGIVNLKTNRKEAALNDLLIAFLIDPSNVSWFKDYHPEMLEFPEVHKILQTLN